MKSKKVSRLNFFFIALFDIKIIRYIGPKDEQLLQLFMPL
ncbi:hypothetical protein H206_01994 [Candidatus Electrothrix aarhusensis]|uniref:Uncharacterized protein n=1 Tax=Candidatus Electrothrix aarhusensis TaxID=1859131 RepID=A0A444ITI8_9BACT|nr:hypothetical protein H206_01994 [Candidatus Electrothrix aarhusensis]